MSSKAITIALRVAYIAWNLKRIICLHPNAHTYTLISVHITKTHTILTSISKLDKYVGMYVQKPF